MIGFCVKWPYKQNPLQIVENFETSYDKSSPFTLGYSKDYGMIENNFLKDPVFEFESYLMTLEKKKAPRLLAIC